MMRVEFEAAFPRRGGLSFPVRKFCVHSTGGNGQEQTVAKLRRDLIGVEKIAKIGKNLRIFDRFNERRKN